jgi:chromosomal replication initiation ATPase DnaA
MSIKENLEKTTIYVIYFENIEFLFQKQKQNMFYTILELVNKSKNIFFAGTTSYFNIMDMMEKRIRSRFIQRSLEMGTPNLEIILSAIENRLTENELTSKKSRKILQNSSCSFETFFQVLSQNLKFLGFFKHYYSTGHNVTDILTRVKYIICEINYLLIEDYSTKIFLNYEEINLVIDHIIDNYSYKFNKSLLTSVQCILTLT